ncbi:MAG: hypothetical protein KAI29_32170, partial [Cyclobacteriaceae bacterium]|nr:hypothetical protein [Cyclobacteriaceae bacterium]
MKFFLSITSVLFLFSLLSLTNCQTKEKSNFENAVIVISDKDISSERVAAQVLIEEVEKRTGFTWDIVTKPPANGHMIFLSSSNLAGNGKIKPEGYKLKIDKEEENINVSITGADSRGVLYGVGKFLKIMEWKKGELNLPENIDFTSSPAYPMRGHQIAYRTLANSYDAWTPEIYEQYIRDLALFGTNSIELIPTGARGPLMKYDPLEMNRMVSEICDKYDVDFWFMTGVEMELSDVAKRDEVVA